MISTQQGNLAAAVTHKVREEIDLPADVISHQILLYPVIAAVFDTDSYMAFQEGFLNDRKDMIWYWKQYVGTDLQNASHPFASVINQPDFVGLPPALVVTSGLDPLSDEGENYARKMFQFGVPVESVRITDAYHGFFSGASESAETRKFLNLARNFLDGDHPSKTAK